MPVSSQEIGYPTSLHIGDLTVEKHSSCVGEIAGICFVYPPYSSDASIFGFSEFASALALLVVIYTISGARYRFRLSIAPVPLFLPTYVIFGVIGFGILISDLWFEERWPIPDFLSNKAVWQGVSGAAFFFLIMVWMYFAFINPPIFSRRNYKKFTSSVFRFIVKGSNDDLPIIADELNRSAAAIVKFSRKVGEPPPKAPTNFIGRIFQSEIREYAYDLLLLIGSRKLCRHIVNSSPSTAMAFFETMSKQKKHRIPIGQFATNISTEALINKDSLLYHEDDGYSSGLIGYVRPFSRTLFGDFDLVEALSNQGRSPIDLDHELLWSWDQDQVAAYSRAVVVTIEDYLKLGRSRQHSYALSRAFNNLKHATSDLYKLDDVPIGSHIDEVEGRLWAVVRFVEESIRAIESQDELPTPNKKKGRRRGDYMRLDLYDLLAKLMFEVIFDASSVTKPVRRCWSVQHNAVWSHFFRGSTAGAGWRIVCFKLRRLLYDEIRDLEQYANYRSSRILGFCLNVLGLKIVDKIDRGSDEYPLKRVVINWTRKNYNKLRNDNLEVANTVLVGAISFDSERSELVKTYERGLRKEAPKEYLEIDL